MAVSIAQGRGKSRSNSPAEPAGERGAAAPRDSGAGRRSRGRPKLMSDAEQAVAIARKAREVFLEKGYGRTTMEDIVARCRISKSTLYRLFPNKLEVFGAVIDDHRQSMLDLPGDYDDLTVEEALARIFRVDIDQETDRQRMALIHFVMVEARQFPELRTLLRQRGGDRSRQALAEWLRTQERKGRIVMSDAGHAAKALMDLAFGAAAPHGDAPWPGGWDRARYLRDCFAMVARGLLPR